MILKYKRDNSYSSKKEFTIKSIDSNRDYVLYARVIGLIYEVYFNEVEDNPNSNICKFEFELIDKTLQSLKFQTDSLKDYLSSYEKITSDYDNLKDKLNKFSHDANFYYNFTFLLDGFLNFNKCNEIIINIEENTSIFEVI